MTDVDIDQLIARRLGRSAPMEAMVPTAAEQVVIDSVLAEVEAEWPGISDLLGLSAEDEASTVLSSDYQAIIELTNTAEETFELSAARERARQVQDVARRLSPRTRAEDRLAVAMERIAEQTYVPAGGAAEFASRTRDGQLCGPEDPVTGACSSRYHSPRCHAAAQLNSAVMREDAEVWNRSLRNRAAAGSLGDQLGLRTRPMSSVSFRTSAGEGVRP